jgi:hypothetical protein
MKHYTRKAIGIDNAIRDDHLGMIGSKVALRA